MQTQRQLTDQARAHFEQQDFAAAEALYRTLIESSPEAADARVMLGMCRFAQGDNSGAIAELEAAVELDDDRAESWFHLARVHRAAGHRRQARDAISRCIERNPRNPLARLESGHQSLGDNNFDGAEQAYRTALRADPNGVPARIALGELLLARGQIDEAHKLASEALRLRSVEPGALLLMSRIFRAQGHGTFAERALHNAIAQRPGQRELRIELAGLLHELKRPGDALEALRSAGPGTSSAEIALLRELGQDAEARRRLEAWHASETAMSTDAIGSLAELRLASGDLDGAEALSRELAERPQAQQFIEALVAEQRGQSDRAVELATALFASEEAYQQRQMRLLVGRLSLASGATQACRDALEPLVETQDDPFAHSLLAQSLDRDGQTRQAAVHLARSGWRDAAIVGELDRLMPEAVVHEVRALKVADWPQAEIKPANQRIIHLLGWPAGARPALLAALSAHPGIRVMPPKDLPRRRDILRLPATPGELLACQATQLEQSHTRYLNAADDDGHSLLLETAGLEAVALPAIAHCLPGSKVLIVNEDLRDLELAWRMAGFRNAASMVSLWRRERELVLQLRAFLPLEFILIDRSKLKSDPGAALTRLTTRLGLDATALADMLAASSAELDALRPAGAWADYADSLFSADEPG